MSDVTTPAGWQPDPFGRYTQRYWDGSTWTQHVTDVTGTQTTDPPAYDVAATGARKAPDVPIPGLVVVIVGAVLVFLSYIALDWFKLNGRTGVDFSDVRDVLSVSNHVPFFSDQYASWGWYVGIAVVVFAVVALFAPALRIAAAIAAGVLAVWHAWVVWDLSEPGVSIQVGAWLGVAGFVVCAVAVLLPRPQT
ncbi:MAG TPA: DUF2510 domain-containing protein [Acidimicrobiales bacterium]|jgi:hypothetical protein